MKYKLGIDLGTSYFKFGVYDQNLNLKGLGRVGVEKDTGQGQLCEVCADRFLDLVQIGIEQACRQAEIVSSQIDAIGYSSQANSFILLDKDYIPLTPLVLWPDGRAEKLYPEIKRLWNDEVFVETTGIGIEPIAELCVNKLLWFKYNQPGIWQKVRHVMSISDYLVYFFTGLRVGDVGTASLLGLIDCRNGEYWGKAFEVLGLDVDLFAKRVTVGSEIGKTNDYISSLIGIKTGAAFYAGSLDHHMAGVDAALGKNADVSVSIGTVLACANFTDAYMPQKDVCVSRWRGGKFCQLAFDENGAKSLEWYQANFAEGYLLEELNEMADQAGGSDGLIARPTAFKYVGLEEAFENIKPHHSHGHFICALMESTAKTLGELVDKLCPQYKPAKIVATGGGAYSDLWLKKCSKIINAKVFRADCHESAIKGAVMVI